MSSTSTRGPRIFAKNSFFKLILGSWDALAGARLRFLAFITLFIVGYSLELFLPWVIGRTLDNFVRLGLVEEAFHNGLRGIGLYCVLRMFCALLHHSARYLQASCGYLARMHALNRTFRGLLSYPLRWHTGKHTGENLSKLTRSSRAVENVVGVYLWQIIEGAVKVLIVTMALSAMDFWVALNVVAVSAVTLTIIIVCNRRVVADIRLNHQFENKLNRICVDTLSNIVTIKTLALERFVQRNLVRQKREGLRYVKRLSWMNELKWCAIACGYATVVSSSLLIYLYSRRGMPGPFDIAAVYVLINYLDKIFQAISSFTSYYGGLVEACTSYEDASAIHDGGQRAPVRQARKDRQTWSSLRVEKVNFAYATEERRGLHQVSVSLRKGEKVALVGPSGGGKSTMLKVLGGLLQADSGTAMLDQGPRLELSTVSTLSMLIPQEPEIFSDTLWFNVTMGAVVDTEELAKVVAICQLEPVVAKLADGWKTNLSEKGLNLSGGEKQRVALARGLLRARSADILLLDEPTSSLDPRTELALITGLLEFFKEKTVLFCCHRWNLLPLFDTVIYMEDGTLKAAMPAAEFCAHTQQHMAEALPKTALSQSATEQTEAVQPAAIQEAA